jgi:hypothetical protein
MGLFDTTWSLQVEKLLPPVLRDCQFIEKNDDFKTGDPENNYIEYIVVSSPGHWKEFPVVGVGIYNYLQGTQSPQVLQRNISLQLKNDIFSKPLVDVRSFPTIYINHVTIEVDGI